MNKVKQKVTTMQKITANVIAQEAEYIVNNKTHNVILVILDAAISFILIMLELKGQNAVFEGIPSYLGGVYSSKI